MQKQTSYSGFMPREIAVTLLTSPQSKTNGFKKRCFRALEKVCEPQSRSTQLNVSAAKTGEQRLQSRLTKANAKQLFTWHKRTLRRANNLLDMRDKIEFTNDNEESRKLVEVLSQRISAYDRLCEAINAEVTARSTRGKGYRKPIKFEKI